MIARDALIDLQIRIDPVALAYDLGLDPDPWQIQTLRSLKRQTIILCTRQAGKSTVTALKNLHVAVAEPGSLCLILAPGERQAGLLLDKVRAFYYRMDRPPPTRKVNELSIEFANGSEIHALPGKEGTVRGFSGVRLLTVDEAARAAESLYYAVRPMLAVSGGEILLLSTPAGKRGFFYETWLASADREDWERIGPIPATFIPRIPAAFLASERRELPEQIYRQEYECAFVDQVGAVFSMDLIERSLSDTDVTPIFSPPSRTGQLFDPAVTPLLDT